MSYRHLISRRSGPLTRLTLNRPDVRNAFNEDVIAELRIGLVHATVPAADFDARVAAVVSEVLAAAPQAIAAAKEMIRRVVGRDTADVRAFTAEVLAARRSSTEGREGMRAFLEKRKASWDDSQGPDR